MNGATEENSLDNDNKIIEGYKAEIKKLWKRARINALAHREATNEYQKRNSRYYIWTIVFSLASILLVICSYLFGVKELNLFSLEYAPLVFTFLSIIASFFSLYFTIFSDHKRFGVMADEHKYTQNSYIYIAQRTREAKSPTITKEKIIALYEDLERDFGILKARGIEPQDKHFEKAHEIFKKISEDPISSDIQSFNSKINDKK